LQNLICSTVERIVACSGSDFFMAGPADPAKAKMQAETSGFRDTA
tara:strand:- start:17834 stop:17968 length:135 start_codon:yes stop_codon:yes gene_type:complete